MQSTLKAPIYNLLSELKTMTINIEQSCFYCPGMGNDIDCSECDIYDECNYDIN